MVRVQFDRVNEALRFIHWSIKMLGNLDGLPICKGKGNRQDL